MYLLTNNENECSGCTACECACPVQAINMVENSEGFLFPKINYDICTKCHICEKICPFESPRYTNNLTPNVFAAYNKKNAERQKSSSGGLFYIIAEYVISQNGIVYGSIMDSDLQVFHHKATTIADLSALRGSKYVQSNLKQSFKEIKQYLLQDIFVYFTGTPCQVAGLKAYLRKDYSNLITSDLICHGVPSQKIFNQYIDCLSKKYDSKIIEYHFRDNKKWNGCEIFSYRTKNDIIKKVVNPGYFSSPYLYSFMYSLILRESCYECKYSCLPRQSDITLADFWGAQVFFKNIDRSKGVSLVLINTEKGLNIWNKIKNNVKYYISDLESAGKYNHNLINQTKRPKLRNSIFSELNKYGYARTAKLYFKSNLNISYFKSIVHNFLQYGKLK